jgi:hypothetical protein
MASPIAPTILTYLSGLEDAVGELANTWRRDDPAYRADVYRQIMMNLSYAYFVYFHADAEHPDWAPLWNPVYLMQPNPDDIYLYSPIRGDLTYRVSGNRGTCKLVTFTTSFQTAGLTDELDNIEHNKDIDDRDLKLEENGNFELLIGSKRPAEYAGNWMQIAPKSNVVMVRYRSWDWANERDPQLSIECLEKVPLKQRPTPEQIVARIQAMCRFTRNMARMFYTMQNGVKERVGINVFEPIRYGPGLQKQIYWPAVFELDDGEALIIETDMPAVRPYWNIQLNDPYFNAVEFVYRLGSLNGATARISSDGKLRAVIALEDPGVPNWLDPSGYKQGTVYGRWYDCDSNPTPTIRRVSLAALREHLPKDTPVITPADREVEIRERVRAAQRRRRW